MYYPDQTLLPTQMQAVRSSGRWLGVLRCLPAWVVWAGCWLICGGFQPSPDAIRQEVPGAVLQSFEKKYPQVELLEWESKGAKYRAAFLTASGNYAEADFKPDGKWIQTSIQIVENQLPAKAQTRWKQDFSEIRSVSSIVRLDKPSCTQYLISFETTETLVNLVFSQKGRLTKKMTEPISLDE